MAHQLIEMSALESGNAMQHNKFWLDLSKKPNSFYPPNTELIAKALIDVNVFELLCANSKRLYWAFLHHIAEFTLRLGDLRFDHTPSKPVDKKTVAAIQSEQYLYKPATPVSHTPVK